MNSEKPCPDLRVWTLPAEWPEARRKRLVYVWDYGPASIGRTYGTLREEVKACLAQRLRLAVMVERLELLPSTVNRKVGRGVSELKCVQARAYYTVIGVAGKESICLLCIGTDKNTQDQDIQSAVKLRAEVENHLSFKESLS